MSKNAEAWWTNYIFWEGHIYRLGGRILLVFTWSYTCSLSHWRYLGAGGCLKIFIITKDRALPGLWTCLWPRCCPGCGPPHSLPGRWSWSARSGPAAGWSACRCRPPCCTRGPGHGSPPAPAPGPGDTRRPAWQHIMVTSRDTRDTHHGLGVSLHPACQLRGHPHTRVHTEAQGTHLGQIWKSNPGY